MFRQLLSTFGIGSAKIDTILERNIYYPGEEIRGQINIIGKEIKQEVKGIYINIITYYIRKGKNQIHHVSTTLASYKLGQPFFIEPNQNYSFPFAVTLPLDTPIVNWPVGLQTKIDIAGTVFDLKDADPLQIAPLPVEKAILDNFQSLGFGLESCECRYSIKPKDRHSFRQKFVFNPLNSKYQGILHSVIVNFHPHSPTKVEVKIEVNKVFGLLDILNQIAGLLTTTTKILITQEHLQQPYENLVIGLDKLLNDLVQQINSK